MKNWCVLFLMFFCLFAVTPSGWTAAKVNINKASAAELQKLPGVGPATAEEIVAYRTKNGNFRSPENLVEVKGVGSKTMEKVRDLITTEESR